MSLTIHIGQCGIEIGDAMLKTLKTHAEAHPDETSDLFKNYQKSRNTNSHIPNSHIPEQLFTPNCLLLDTEEKVVNKTIKNGLSSGIDYKHHWSKFSGSGNNWAHGYNGHAEGSKVEILEKIQKVLEPMDSCESICLIHSLAGGTGSGLGTGVFRELLLS